MAAMWKVGVIALAGTAWVIGAPEANAQLPVDTEAWRIAAAESRVEQHLGREALYLRGGTAWLEGVSFGDGVIEFDLATSEEQGFHGVRFRAVDPRNHEHLYIRPHLSGKPDATQYNPIFNGVSSWQIFSDPRYVQPLVIPAGRWIRVRIAIEGRRAELRLDGGEPIVFPHLVRDPTEGLVAVASSGAGAWFANVQVMPDADPGFSGGSGAPPIESPEGMVLRWRVSEPFPESSIDGVTTLADDVEAGLRWVPLDAEGHGLANLARARVRSDSLNTVFAAVTLRSTERRTVAVRVAFSDRVRVFLERRLLFAGADEYASRDYRFLGTMGLYDTILVPLEAGDNELMLAVSEDFGGWGVGLQVPRGRGVSVIGPVRN